SNASFTNNVTLTKNPISSGAVNEDLIDDLELETKDELRAEHPQFDHVKAWKAPYTGTITITGSAWLRAKNNCGNSGEQNQFRLWIERATEGQTTAAQVIGNSEKNFTSVGSSQSYSHTITVNKGELLFFRAHNKTYGCGGEVEWNPQITYT